MEDIDSQLNIREFSVQSFRKICDSMVLAPPKAVLDSTGPDKKRFLLLEELYKRVLEYAGTPLPESAPGERPGQFMQTHRVIEALGRYWHVHSMNLETIIDEFVFNAIGPDVRNG
jgi:hypothetical protein